MINIGIIKGIKRTEICCNVRLERKGPTSKDY